MLLSIIGFIGCESTTYKRSIADDFYNSQSYKIDVIILKLGEQTICRDDQRTHFSDNTWGNWWSRLTESVQLRNNGGMGPSFCKGCDSCLTAYKDAGLINYKIVKDLGYGSAIYNVTLTKKGSKYVLDEKYLPDDEIEWKKRYNVEYIVLSQDKILNIKNIRKGSSFYIYSEIETVKEHTPFGEIFAGKSNKAETTQVSYTYEIED